MVTISNFFNSISHNKEDNDFSDAEFEKDYSPFLVNKNLSYHVDSVLVANEMNTRKFIDNKNQFRFLYLIVPKLKRNIVWAKATKDKNLEIVSKYYKISLEKAESYLKILDNNQIEDLKSRMELGGRVK